jgi:hypothetical protein
MTPEGMFNQWKLRCPDLLRLLGVVEACGRSGSRNRRASRFLGGIVLGSLHGRLVAAATDSYWWLVTSAEADEFVPWTLFPRADVLRLKKRLSHRSSKIRMVCDGSRVLVNWTSTAGSREHELPLVRTARWPAGELVGHINRAYPDDVYGNWRAEERYGEFTVSSPLPPHRRDRSWSIQRDSINLPLHRISDWVDRQRTGIIADWAPYYQDKDDCPRAAPVRLRGDDSTVFLET